uniref:Uncharacterized protein n=1 Tax=Lactuca sativa TaxID=4236 RepID=A0A9R1XC35_LACSA|nr:hypothetical protein LSAT_V11C500238220 [Lactuca sativa]
MGRSTTREPTIPNEVSSEETNGENNNSVSCGPLTSAQRIIASSGFNEVSPDPFRREAKHFTEIHVLNRDSDGESAKDLAMELIENVRTLREKYPKLDIELPALEESPQYKQSPSNIEKAHTQISLQQTDQKSNLEKVRSCKFLPLVYQIASRLGS